VGLCGGDMLNLEDLPVLKWPLQEEDRNGMRVMYKIGVIQI
jgi:hypothetical protein